jgi:hypothetical protein
MARWTTYGASAVESRAVAASRSDFARSNQRNISSNCERGVSFANLPPRAR